MSVARNIVTSEALLDTRVRIPQGVVYRSFVKETVILNLESGRYHGVNPTGGRVLETLEKVGSVSAAAKILASDYGRPLSEIETDVCEFCESLLERGLLVVDPA